MAEMATPTVLADCGNSAIKFALASTRCDPQAITVCTRRWDAWDAWRHQAGSVGDLVILPGNRIAARQVAAWWRARGEGGQVLVLGQDLPMPDLGHYATCGADRCCAGIAASSETTDPVVVIDAGTAVTVTAWRRRPDGAPCLAGGMILPSARAALRGLTTAAPALGDLVQGQDQGDDAVDPLAMESANAMRSAVAIGHPAMVAACLAAVEDALHVRFAAAPILYTTGGGAKDLPPAIQARARHRPHLVLAGLARIVDHQRGHRRHPWQ